MQPGAPQKVLGPAMALAVVGILASSPPPLEADPPATAPAPGSLFLYPERIDLGEEGFVRADRGMLFVPARRSDPESAVIGIEIYRFSALHDNDLPPIFQLFGGPGWPGFGDALEKEGNYAERIRPMTELSDLVVVGQRGIGSSKPDTRCEPPPAVGPDVVLNEEEQAARWREASAKCREFWESQGLDLGGFNVVEAAADVNDARKALGYDRIILSGGSFGSHWSMAVMRYHPEIVARAVLTGLEGPDHTYDMPGETLEDLERIAAAVEAAPELQELIPEGGLLNAYREVIKRAEKEPIEIRVEDDEGESQTVRFDVEDVRSMSMGYTGAARSRRGLPAWPAQMLELIAGDFENAAREALGDGRNFPTASFFMLDCGSGISRARATEMAADPGVATVGKLGSFYRANCPAWGSDLGEEFRQNFETEIPTLLVHGDWDLSTPLGNARDLAPFFKKGKLTVIEGGTHGAMREALAEADGFREALTHFIRTGDLEAMPERVKLPPIEWEVPGAEAEVPEGEE